MRAGPPVEYALNPCSVARCISPAVNTFLPLAVLAGLLHMSHLPLTSFLLGVPFASALNASSAAEEPPPNQSVCATNSSTFLLLRVRCTEWISYLLN